MAVVTVSRQLGSAGDIVAEKAAQILGYDFVDKNLITAVAHEANVPESEVEKYDERVDSPIKRFLKSLITPKTTIPASPAFFWGFEFPYDASAALLAQDIGAAEEAHFLDEEKYLKFLQTAIHKLWQRDNVIVVGRGGQVILRDKPSILHVRTVASFEDRCRMAMWRWNLTREQAADLVIKSAKRRYNYIKTSYHVDWDDPALYHLIINTGRTGIDLAAHMIVEAVRNIENAGWGRGLPPPGCGGPR